MRSLLTPRRGCGSLQRRSDLCRVSVNVAASGFARPLLCITILKRNAREQAP